MVGMGLGFVGLVALGWFISVYISRFQTIGTIEKVTDYADYNLYRMDVKYNYDLDRLIEYGITDDQSFVDEADGDVLMGRNYDFRQDTSALLVYCEPEGGYRSASTEEAVALLSQYDMFAAGGRDYHFYITDSTGDGRVVEYDCESADRKMVVTPVCTVTNFFALYPDKVLPGQRNGIYGHGKERYEKIEAIFDYEETYTTDTAWEVLKAAAQEPSAEDITSNTQWSIVYNDTALTAEIVLRRNWNDVIRYDLNDNKISFRQ